MSLKFIARKRRVIDWRSNGFKEEYVGIAASVFEIVVSLLGFLGVSPGSNNLPSNIKPTVAQNSGTEETNSVTKIEINLFIFKVVFVKKNKSSKTTSSLSLREQNTTKKGSRRKNPP